MHSLWKFEPTARWLHARLWGQGWRYAEYRRCFTARSRWAFSRRCFTDEMIALPPIVRPLPAQQGKEAAC
jgi:hypothetical protein